MTYRTRSGIFRAHVGIAFSNSRAHLWRAGGGEFSPVSNVAIFRMGQHKTITSLGNYVATTVYQVLEPRNWSLIFRMYTHFTCGLTHGDDPFNNTMMLERTLRLRDGFACINMDDCDRVIDDITQTSSWRGDSDYGCTSYTSIEEIYTELTRVRAATGGNCDASM